MLISTNETLMSDLTVAIPFRTDAETKRQYLTSEQVFDFNYIADFVQKFSNCFAYDNTRSVYWFFPNGDAPQQPYWLG